MPRLARTPFIQYLHPVRQPYETSERRNADNYQPDNRAGAQSEQDNRTVRPDLKGTQQSGFEGGVSGTNVWANTGAGTGAGPSNDPEPEEDRGNREQVNSAQARLREDIQVVEQKADQLDKSVGQFEEDWEKVPERVQGIESGMAARGPYIDDLRQREVNHSARIHALEEAVRSVKVQNDTLRGELVRRGELDEQEFRNGFENMDYRQKQMHYPASPPGQGQVQGQGLWSYRDDAEAQRRQRAYEQERYGQGQQMGKKLPPNEQHRFHLGFGELDGQEYWGFNKFYKPEFATSYRREQAQLEIAKGGLGQVIHDHPKTPSSKFLRAIFQIISRVFNGKRHVLPGPLLTLSKPYP